MHLAETIDGGSLRKAVEKKKDEPILHHIRSEDFVAIEVRYNNRYNKSYTQFLKKGERHEITSSERLYQNLYELFSKER